MGMKLYSIHLTVHTSVTYSFGNNMQEMEIIFYDDKEFAIRYVFPIKEHPGNIYFIGRNVK